ncbi:hypothetical protein [uncultured Desulfobulbus sp.]|uniref:hypothetical protein n=1 Tax=uncultured Desulfobulbus sp. TaxID=239745 RepID=UPI0029C6E595|nr:hypothetical protein [uncultured Desulfobulbus sp.]
MISGENHEKNSTKPAPENKFSKLEVKKSIKIIRILYRGTCSKLTARGRGDLSYEIGIDEDTSKSYVRISTNDSSGAFSSEGWTWAIFVPCWMDKRRPSRRL